MNGGGAVVKCSKVDTTKSVLNSLQPFFNVLILQGPMEASIREEEAMLEAVPDQAI